MSYSDDLISPQLQSLIKKVYQECSRIITSKNHATPSNRHHVPDLKVSSLSHDSQDGTILLDRQDKASSNPPMSRQQEQWTPQETVIALRELLCRLAQRQSQSDGKDDWRWDQLCRRVESELKAELEESKKQLKCAHDAQQEQNKKISSLRLALDEGEEALKMEQNRVQELQQQLERERAVSLRKDREVEESRGTSDVDYMQQKIEVMALKDQVVQETMFCSNLRLELQLQQFHSMLLQNRLEETQQELEYERQQWNIKQEVSMQEKTHLERLLSEAESRSAENHSKLSDVQRKLDDVIDRCSRQVDELSHRHEADAARDKKFISDLCVQLEQERRQGEELASEMDRLRAEFLQSKRKWEEEDRVKREELDREREADVQHRVALEALKEQKHEANHALEVEQELAEPKERLQQLKNKEREMEEQWQRERKKVMQEQMERERCQQRTNNKLCELELLRQQDQQRMQELQRTLVELEREAREMAAQRLNGQTIGTDSMQTNQQMSTPRLMETLLKENSELTEHVTSLSQERTVLQHRFTCLERDLRRTELELAKLKTETENMPVSDVTSNSEVQHLYGRYLRAESFRKALMHQKRYLLLLLGGFQDCEQVRLCLIANMGVRPSPPLSSQCTPRGRFRAAVLAVVAISRMKFLNRKWHQSIECFHLLLSMSRLQGVKLKF